MSWAAGLIFEAGFIAMEVALALTGMDQAARPQPQQMQMTYFWGSLYTADPSDINVYNYMDEAMGGRMPCTSVWSKNGTKIGKDNSCTGQEPNSGKLLYENIKAGNSRSVQFEWIDNDNSRDPGYLAVSQPTHDGICLSGFRYSGGQKDILIWGDQLLRCGYEHKESSFVDRFGPLHWSYSNTSVGAGYDNGQAEDSTTANRTRCVWLDGDHSTGIATQTITLELDAFNIHKELINHYSQDRGRLCESTPRLAQWPYLSHHTDIIPIFSPPLRYAEGIEIDAEGIEIDAEDQIKDSYDPVSGEYEYNKNVAFRPERTFAFNNTKKNPLPQHILDHEFPFDMIGDAYQYRRMKMIGWNKYKYDDGPTTNPKMVSAEKRDDQEHGPETFIKRHFERVDEINKASTFNLHRRGNNQNIHWLIISDNISQPASLICKDRHARMSDYVNTYEGMMCDMEHRRLYPLCERDDHHECFDLERRELRPHIKARSEEILKYRLDRKYRYHEVW